VPRVVVGDTVHVDVAGLSVPFRVVEPPDVTRAARDAAAHAGGPVELVAPMPGVVIAVEVAIGDAVATGEAVVTLEAMKMEHAVVAPGGGTVTDLTVVVGDQVERGQRLASVEP
jgi:3-methylcrotonyl-CoA carboxylase alpha subunit